MGSSSLSGSLVGVYLGGEDDGGFEKFRIKICYTYTIAPYLCVRSDAKVAMLK